MKSNNILKKQKKRFLLYNLIAFFAIFVLLGFVAVLAIESYFYRDADMELTLCREQLTNPQQDENPPDKPQDGSPEKPNPNKNNPRISYALYDGDKNFLDGLSNLRELNLGSLPVPGTDEQKYNKNLDGFNYRVLEFSFQSEGVFYYAQIFINIDGEIALRNNIVSIYLICLSIIIVLTVAASFLMSVLTMKPIKNSIEEQTRFVSDASHELRTPLTVLYGRLEQLLSYPEARIIDKSEEISDCLSEVMRLTRLSSNLLTLAKSDSDKFVPVVSDIDIFELINKTLLPYIDMAAFDNKEFIISGENIRIKADINKIKQALIAVFDNALKYTNSGDKITVDTRKIKNKCVITIADTGIGISEKGLPKIFDRFYRDDSSRNITEGSGLGLSIVKQIIEEHKGSISVCNNVPKGTKFVILLPIS